MNDVNSSQNVQPASDATLGYEDHPGYTRNLVGQDSNPPSFLTGFHQVSPHLISGWLQSDGNGKDGLQPHVVIPPSPTPTSNKLLTVVSSKVYPTNGYAQIFQCYY